jgi:predicted RNase H-like HicB family nuclease
MKLKVLVQADTPTGYQVHIPALPGCSSRGNTVDEALINLKTAASDWLDEAMNDLEVEIVDAGEDQKAFERALAIKIPEAKLKQLVKTRPPYPSWFSEEFHNNG